MTDRDAGGTGDVPDEQTFLARWSRRKAEARAGGAVPASARRSASDIAPTDASPAQGTTTQDAAAEDATAHDTTTRDSTARGKETTEAAPSAEPNSTAPAAALPDLDQLDQDSDYSAFLAPGVDAELRRRALRKLFHSSKFNTFDGLDTYRDDFTSFPALGDVVTVDMRHQLERLAERVVEETAPPARDLPPTSLPPVRDPPPASDLPPARDPPATAAAVLKPNESAQPIHLVPGPQVDDEPRDPA